MQARGLEETVMSEGQREKKRRSHAKAIENTKCERSEKYPKESGSSDMRRFETKTCNELEKRAGEAGFTSPRKRLRREQSREEGQEENESDDEQKRVE